jgi:hypothetical protein
VKCRVSGPQPAGSRGIGSRIMAWKELGCDKKIYIIIIYIIKYKIYIFYALNFLYKTSKHNTDAMFGICDK